MKSGQFNFAVLNVDTLRYIMSEIKIVNGDGNFSGKTLPGLPLEGQF